MLGISGIIVMASSIGLSDVAKSRYSIAKVGQKLYLRSELKIDRSGISSSQRPDPKG
jgi:hypothetical protein